MGKQKIWAIMITTLLFGAGVIQVTVTEWANGVKVIQAEENSEVEKVSLSAEAESETVIEARRLIENRAVNDENQELELDIIEPTYVNGVLIVNKGYGLPKDFGSGEDPEAREAYEEMKKAARQEGYKLKVFSTYRDYETQRRIYERYAAIDGQQETDRYSAKPGYSEHQTGLAFDIGWRGYKTSVKMGETREGIWLQNNSHKFGFILRYPKNKEHITGYKYEPWHFRYVGVDIAQKVYESGLSLDEYLKVIYPVYR